VTVNKSETIREAPACRTLNSITEKTLCGRARTPNCIRKKQATDEETNKRRASTAACWPWNWLASRRSDPHSSPNPSCLPIRLKHAWNVLSVANVWLIIGRFVVN